MNKQKAQTATEYLIILAVVIIIALIVVAIIGRGTEIAGGTGDSVASLGWQGAPGVGVMSAVFSANSVDSLTLRNNVGGQPITIFEINITSPDGSIIEAMNTSANPVQIGAGQSRTISNTTVAGGLSNPNFACVGASAGDRFSVGITIRYREDSTGAFRVTSNSGARFEGSCAE